MSNAHAIQQVRFTDAQALEWLRLRGTVKISCMALAQQFGWHRNTVGSKLQSWASKGEILRDGRTIIVQKRTAQGAAQAAQQTAQPAQGSAFVHKALGAVLVAAGIALICALIYINAKAWGSFMQSSEDAWAIRTGAIVVDLLSALLPTIALYAKKRHLWKIWSMWALCVAILLWTVIGFTFGNFGNTVGSREAAIEQREAMRDARTIKKKQLDAFPPFSPVSQEMLNAKVQKRKTDCDPDHLVVSRCRTAQGEMDAYAQAKELTDRKQALAAEIMVLTSKIELLPIIASADPIISGGLDTFNRMLGIKIDPGNASSIRNWVIAIIFVCFPGALISIGFSLI